MWDNFKRSFDSYDYKRGFMEEFIAEIFCLFIPWKTQTKGDAEGFFAESHG